MMLLPLSRGNSDSLENSDGLAKQRFCSEERWDFGVEEDLSFVQVDWLDELATDVESLGSSTTVSGNEEEDEEEICCANEVATKHDEWDAKTTNLGVQEHSWAPLYRTMPSYGEPAHQPARYAFNVHGDQTRLPVRPLAMDGLQRSPWTALHPVMPMAYQPLLPYYSGPQTTDLRQNVKQAPGTKRLWSEDFSVDDPSHVRPKSARISSKRQDQMHLEAEAAAVQAAAAAAAAAAVHVPLPNMAMLEHVSSLPCCPRNVRPSHFPVRTTILPCCKFTSKQSKQGCKGELSVVTHKRGHLAVSCSARHQWVWCALCCNCISKCATPDKRQRGCQVPSHWFERDAFDTGARNHMNVHKAGSK